MNLLDYQRAVLRVSFDLEPSADDLSMLGNEPRFRMYRHMVQSRLEGMAELAFKQALSLVGEAAFSASFSRFLSQRGARSPLIREVTAAFGRFAQADAALLEGAPAHASALFAFELAKWEVAYVPGHSAHETEGLRELDFEGKPVLNRALRRLSMPRTILPYCDLDPAPAEDGPHFSLLIYRPPHNEVRWWAVSPFFACLVARFEHGQESVADSVRAAAEERTRDLDERLLEELSTDLTLAVQRGVLLGVRD